MITICGEAVVDVLATGPTTFESKPGGSPANTAVACARLGLPVSLLARLSRDRFGQQLRAHLVANGVDLRCAVDADEPSSLAIVSRDGTGTASYRFVLADAADWQWTDDELVLPSGTVALHAGSLALALSPAVERLLGRAGCTVCIDPNLRPGLPYGPEDMRTAVARWLRLADIVKISTEDLAYLHPGEDHRQVAARWARSGPNLVVVTEGAGGATAFFDDQVLHADAAPTDVVDTVGAGDTFTAGLLGGLHQAGRLGGRLSLTADDVGSALDLGLRAAAVTCSRAGADPPYLAEL